MNRSPHLADPHKVELIKKRHFTFRLNIFFFVIFFLFSILVVRLALLQFVEGEELTKQENQTFTINSPLAPIRGNIYDRDSFPIATTVSEQSLFYQADGGRDKQQVVRLARQVADIFRRFGDPNRPPLSAEEVLKRMDVGYDLNLNDTTEPNYYSSPRRVKENLTESEIAYILGHRDELNGFDVREETIRKYESVDNQWIAAQLVGYLRPYDSVVNTPTSYLDFYRDSATNSEYLKNEYVGLDGLELMFQDELRGRNGHRIYPINSLQQIVGPVTVESAKKGNNLQLTIQKDVQLAAQRAITEHLEWLKSDEAKKIGTPYKGREAVAGYAVAMEVDTGQVVAMASMPDYDPNIWRGGISDQDWNHIQYQYTNGTIRDRYPDLPADVIGKHPTSMVPPGSTLKPLTVLFGLNEGLITTTERYNDKGIFYYGKNNNAQVPNSDGYGYGNINAADAIWHSSNTFMAEMIGNRLYTTNKIPDDQKLALWDKYMKDFGLGVTTGSGLPGENAGVISYDDTTKRYSLQAALVQASFGQQAKYTALQLAQYASMLANHGKRMKPQFVQKITDFDNRVVRTFEPEVLNEVEMPDKYWDVIEQGMSKVGVHGFEDFKYGLLRKTGTSQSDIAGQKLDNAVFIAYAPADHPKLAVAVVVPEGGFGSYGAAPIARKIFDAYDQYVGLTDKPADSN